MPYTLSSVLGILCGFIFIYFPILSIFFASLPAIIYSAKKKYLIGILCLILSLAGFFYGNLVEREYRENINNKETLVKFKGHIVSSKDNIHLFKTIEGKNLRVYFREKIEENRAYTVECKKVDEHKNPCFFSTSDFCYAIKVTDEGVVNLNFFEKAQKSINDEIKARLNEKVAPVMIAMTTGHRYEISREIREDFQRTGLIHLLSISGAHFSLLFTVFFIIFKTLTHLIPCLLYT
ncbi:MAG: competence protein ComEC family protein, partial [Thermodesulfovibrio sp.]|nr:competence protein ComEC family protein [Thermodesulfovibrio sp.]